MSILTDNDIDLIDSYNPDSIAGLNINLSIEADTGKLQVLKRANNLKGIALLLYGDSAQLSGFGRAALRILNTKSIKSLYIGTEYTYQVKEIINIFTGETVSNLSFTFGESFELDTIPYPNSEIVYINNAVHYTDLRNHSITLSNYFFKSHPYLKEGRIHGDTVNFNNVSSTSLEKLFVESRNIQGLGTMSFSNLKDIFLHQQDTLIIDNSLFLNCPQLQSVNFHARKYCSFASGDITPDSLRYVSIENLADDSLHLSLINCKTLILSYITDKLYLGNISKFRKLEALSIQRLTKKQFRMLVDSLKSVPITVLELNHLDIKNLRHKDLRRLNQLKLLKGLRLLWDYESTDERLQEQLSKQVLLMQKHLEPRIQITF